MKKYIIVSFLIFLSVKGISQENRITVSGGYVFANIEEADQNTNGFRINGSYEFNPSGGAWAHGISVGYTQTKASNTSLLQTHDYKITTVPYYYAPKFLFGNESLKGFIKGALGMHSSWFEKSGTLGTISDKGFGFYGGAGLGGMKTFGEKIFISVEYEWAYMSNAYYQDGFMNSIMGGIGLNF
jgi:hypothetical protein